MHFENTRNEKSKQFNENEKKKNTNNIFIVVQTEAPSAQYALVHNQRPINHIRFFSPLLFCSQIKQTAANLYSILSTIDLGAEIT